MEFGVFDDDYIQKRIENRIHGWWGVAANLAVIAFLTSLVGMALSGGAALPFGSRAHVVHRFGGEVIQVSTLTWWAFVCTTMLVPTTFTASVLLYVFSLLEWSGVIRRSAEQKAKARQVAWSLARAWNWLAPIAMVLFGATMCLR